EQECRRKKQGSLHVKSELTEVGDDASPRHSSSPTYEYG
uniref:Histocompatibility minor HB-1 n=1 Tax=Prolemur simus TaxID=1328070 RepID=A0A8C8ZJZ1_PROSS